VVIHHQEGNAFWDVFFPQVGLDGLKPSDEEAAAPQPAMCHDCFKWVTSFWSELGTKKLLVKMCVNPN